MHVWQDLRLKSCRTCLANENTRIILQQFKSIKLGSLFLCGSECVSSTKSVKPNQRNKGVFMRNVAAEFDCSLSLHKYVLQTNILYRMWYFFLYLTTVQKITSLKMVPQTKAMILTMTVVKMRVKRLLRPIQRRYFGRWTSQGFHNTFHHLYRWFRI